MSFVEDGFLFLTPTVSEAVAAGRFVPQETLRTADHGVDEATAQLTLKAIAPALRAIILMGYRPWKIEMGTGPNNRIEILLSHNTVASVPVEAGAPQHWSGGSAFKVVIHTFPYNAPDRSEPYVPHAFLPHKLIPPSGNQTSSEWAFLDESAGSAQNALELPETEPSVFLLSLLSIDPDLGTAGSIADGPVAAFTNDCLPVLETAYNSGDAMTNRGLLWLFDPTTWYPFDEDGTPAGDPKFLKLMKDIAAEAHLPSNSAGVRAFLEGQIAGNVKADAVLYEVNNKKMRSRSRARRFLRMVRKWSQGDDAPTEAYTDDLDLALRTLGWFDLILCLISTGFLLPRGLPDVTLVVVGELDEDPVTREPLVAQRIGDQEVRLRVLATDGNADIDDDGETDGYRTIVYLQAQQIPLPDMTALDPPIAAANQAPSTGYRQIETMCTWEYIPANADQPKPQLLVLVGPGVTILPFNYMQYVDLVILRKQDYGIPSWGAPIIPSQLFAPIVIQGKTPSPLAQTSEQPTWVIYPQHDGGSLVHLFDDLQLPNGADDLSQITQSPSVTLKIETVEILDGDSGYRLDCDFVTIEEANTPSRPEPVTPILNLWQTTTNINTTVTRNWWSNYTGHFWETPNVRTIFENFPHRVPVTTPNYWEYYAAVPQDSPTHSEHSTRARSVWDLADLPTLDASDLESRGFNRIASSTMNYGDPSLILEYQWTAIDWFLIPVDIAVGFTPVGNVIDVVEFAYAWNTMRDRYGRPITQLDLWMMGVGAAVPFAGTALFRSGADAGVSIGQIWRAAPDAEDTTTLVDAVRGAGRTDEKAFREVTEAAADVAVDANRILGGLIDASAGAVARTDASISDVVNQTGDTLLNPQLQREYQQWVAQELLQGRIP